MNKKARGSTGIVWFIIAIVMAVGVFNFGLLDSEVCIGGLCDSPTPPNIIKTDKTPTDNPEPIVTNQTYEEDYTKNIFDTDDLLAEDWLE